ncbi:MAG TPA: hypothetical protein VFV47_05315 [Hyphomicrobiaceae bacterium]|nr:hypothetical protein [Hyphomicrobiaceae bacterium]
MTPRGWLPALATVIVADVGAMLYSAATGRMQLVLGLAALFAAVMTAAAIAINRPLWRYDGPSLKAPQHGLGINARLMALVYFWGALAMQGLYTTRLTGMKWQHGWQYASAMLLLAIGALVFAWGLGSHDDARRNYFSALAVPLAIFQGISAAFGVLFLVVSSKLTAVRADWGANQVFLFGALTVMVLAAVSLRTHSRLVRGDAGRVPGRLSGP